MISHDIALYEYLHCISGGSAVYLPHSMINIHLLTDTMLYHTTLQSSYLEATH